MAAASNSHPNSGRKRSAEASLAEFPVREAKIQLGARISELKNRQLKLAAVLGGATVQNLVEQAIDEFFANHLELFPSPLTGAPKSTPRKSR
jgi:hypothetical protein